MALEPVVSSADRPRRRRPTTRKGRPTLTADLIAEGMLELAGRMGFHAVTMRVLAEHLGVTVRALYNYVEDRQEIVDRAANLFIARRPAPELDPRDWERSLADYSQSLRTVYRRHPRALLVSLDEQIRDPAVHPTGSCTPRRCWACCAPSASISSAPRSCTATSRCACSVSCSSST
ncbi:MAG: TetR/AcrR family transcriptional regulator, partial [Actinomycetes bacterium]